MSDQDTYYKNMTDEELTSDQLDYIADGYYAPVAIAIGNEIFTRLETRRDALEHWLNAWDRISPNTKMTNADFQAFSNMARITAKILKEINREMP